MHPAWCQEQPQIFIWNIRVHFPTIWNWRKGSIAKHFFIQQKDQGYVVTKEYSEEKMSPRTQIVDFASPPVLYVCVKHKAKSLTKRAFPYL